MTRTTTPRDPVGDGAASLLIPGLGQWLQHRRAAGIWFATEAAAAVVAGIAVPGLRTVAFTAAAAIALWSVIDAARAASRGV